MEDLKLSSVQIQPDSLRSALKELDTAIRKHSKMKELIEQLLNLQDGNVSARSSTAKGTRRRGRPPRGEKTLRQTIVDVLSKSKVPLRPIELKAKVLEAGYPTTATASSFYTAVFNTARNESSVVKTADGFALKAGGASTKKKKRGRPKSKKAKKS